MHGPLEAIHPLLYERGGRLWKISTINDFTREDLVSRWGKQSPNFVDDERAYSHWLEFEPGQWWINAMFAFRDGIIDSKTTDGGICADAECAYAIVLKDDDEVEGSWAHKFTYRCRSNDKGRYRLTSGRLTSRFSVRILRSHSLASLWAPRAGIRYEGLFHVTGWKMFIPEKEKSKPNPELVWEISFERDPNQISIDEVLQSPHADEVDDYREYKRLRRLQREWLRHQATAKLTGEPVLTLAAFEKSSTKALPQRTQTMYKDGRIVFPPSDQSASRTSTQTFSSSSPVASNIRAASQSSQSQVAPFTRHQAVPKPIIPPVLDSVVPPTTARQSNISKSAMSLMDALSTPTRQANSSTRATPSAAQASQWMAIPRRQDTLTAPQTSEPPESPSRQTTSSSILPSSSRVIPQASSGTTHTGSTIVASPTRHSIIKTASASSSREGASEKKQKKKHVSLEKARNSPPPDDMLEFAHRLRAMPGSFALYEDSPPPSPLRTTSSRADTASPKDTAPSRKSIFALSRFFDGVVELSPLQRIRRSPARLPSPPALNIKHQTYDEAMRQSNLLRIMQEAAGVKFSPIDWSDRSGSLALKRAASSTRGTLITQQDFAPLSPRSRPTRLQRDPSLPSIRPPPSPYLNPSLGVLPPLPDSPRSSQSIPISQPLPTPQKQRTPEKLDPRAIERARFQRLLRTDPPPFGSIDSARRFLKALGRVWGMLGEPEYPDMLVGRWNSRVMSSSLDGSADMGDLDGTVDIADLARAVDGAAEESEDNAYANRDYGGLFSKEERAVLEYFGFADMAAVFVAQKDNVQPAGDIISLAHELRERHETSKWRTNPALAQKALGEYLDTPRGAALKDLTRDEESR